MGIRGNAHKKAVGRTEVIELISSKLSSFYLLQQIFAESTILTHFNSKQ